MAERKIIKVCGMTDGDNIREVENLGVDLMGFIFYPKSPRRVKTLPSYLPSNVKKVGVFVNVSPEEILVQDIRYHFDYVQLHGNESPQVCMKVKDYGLKVIKAFSISEKSDIDKVKDYAGICDYFVFDTKTVLVGGSGNTFDWTILDGYKENVPFLLSGGLSLENIDQIKAFSHESLAGYDLNSKFEIEPGIKDISKLKQFIDSIYEQN